MIAALLALPRPIRAAIAGLAAAIALGIAAALWVHFHDKSVVRQHETEVSAQVGAATDAANETANANDARRQLENAKAEVLTQEALRHAENEHPAEVRRPAGPAVRAVADQLRRRTGETGAPAGR